MKISCEEAATICNKSQYKEAGLWETIKLRFHIFTCKTCAKFTKKNKTLTTLCDKANLNTLSEAEKKVMKKDLEQRL
ncbi:hypothetical protein [Flagellimonas myxillae]|uniref:hypothetical protein n=1 Tax=Flagellimonas myxillae TaxID=2942214 RepID=UPI00201EBEC7|nr:hypothetical protein [Muricauda myxillae]MCL6264892.1 hypothetical protein [Muricauda myxillae]